MTWRYTLAFKIRKFFMSGIKSFDINQWIQGIIGALLLGAIFTIIKMYGDVETSKIEKKQDSQVILRLDMQVNVLTSKINELSQKQALIEQAVKFLASKTKGMEGMGINSEQFPPPKLVSPVYRPDIQASHQSKSDDNDLPPVPPPPPPAEPDPKPSKQ